MRCCSGVFALYSRTSRFFSAELGKPVIPAVNKDLRQEADGQGGENVHRRVLLNKADRKTDHDYQEGERRLPTRRKAFVFQSHRQDPQGIGRMQGRADAGVGIEGIDKLYNIGQYILPWEDLGPQILTAGPEDIAEHGHRLRNHDKGLQLSECRHVIEQRIGQGAEDEEIPAHIEDHEELVKGDQIIQRAVDGMAALRRDQVFGDKIQSKVDNPAAQQLQMGKARLVQPLQGKAAVIIRLFFHRYRPPGGCFSDTGAWGCWDKGPPCAPAGRRRSP